jgi:uncharacterized protein YkwD
MKNRLLYLFISSTIVLTLFSCVGNEVVNIEDNYETVEIIEETKTDFETENIEKEETEEDKETSAEPIEEKPEEIDETKEDEPEEVASEDISSEEEVTEVEIEEEQEIKEEVSVDETKEEDKEQPKEEVKEEKKEEVQIPDSFDANFYANNNPDVVAACGNSPEALYKHYVNYGKKEGRPQNASEAEQKAQKEQQAQQQVNQQSEQQQQVGEPNNIVNNSSPNAVITYDVFCDSSMLNLINAYRTENGLPELSWNAEAEQIAKDRIKAIAEGGVLSHEAAGGPPAGYVAENLFQSSSSWWTADAIFNGYKGSAGHDANMKNANATSCVIATCNVSKSIGGLSAYG